MSTLVVNFCFDDSRSIGTTEVIATCGATIASNTTPIYMTEVTVTAGCQVGVEVMTTTPCGTIGIIVIHIVIVLVAAVFKVVGQGEQETSCCIVVVVVSAGPRLAVVATNQFASAQLEHRNRRSFVVTSAVEGGCACTVNAALVTQCPDLVRGSCPTVDLIHVGLAENRGTLEVVVGTTLHTVVVRPAAILTLAITGTTTSALTIELVGVAFTVCAGSFTEVTVASRTRVYARLGSTRTLTIGLR